MLILSRQQDQSIIIGDYEVVVTVVDIRGSSVRLGIQAGPDIEIHRLEVKQIIDKERERQGNTEAETNKEGS